MKTDRKAELSALVTVRWGDTVVATKHLAEGASATVGADVTTVAPIPCEPLGLPAVVVAEMRGGAPVAFIPRGAVGFRERPRRLPSPLAGPSEITLAAGDTVSFSIGQFVVAVTAEESAKAPWAAAAPLSSALSPVRHVAVAALAHALLIGLSAQAAHASAIEQPIDEHADIQRYLAAADERSRLLEETPTSDGSQSLGVDVNEHDGNGKDGGGTRAKGPEGAMGAEASRAKGGGRWAVAGGNPKEYTMSHTREEALRDARDFGMVGVVATPGTRSPAWDWDRAVATGPDAFGARGAMWGTAIGETHGAGGLGLTGVGEGGGGTGEGIGMGDIGTIGHTFGRPGPGTGGGGGMFGGFGISGGSWGGTWGEGIGIGYGSIGTIGYGAGYSPDWLKPPRRERPEKVEEDGENRLPPHVIRRIVRANAGRFRLCYQGALLTNPGLAGGVTTRFMIGADGRVKSAQNLSADLSDKTVVGCVTRSFYGLVFPEPPNGKTVTVTYPLTFSPER
jgi:hypothetical protein